MTVNNVANKVVHPSNNVITALFNDQYCCYFLTGLNNNVMITIAMEACSINIVFRFEQP